MLIYEGLFFDGEEANKINELEPIHLSKQKDLFHTTFKFKPSIEEIFDEIVGKEFEVIITGYGCDGKNSGFRIELPDELIAYYTNKDKDNNLVIPHITVSLSDDGKAKDTSKLQFKDLQKPFKIKGRFGYWIRDKKGEYLSFSKFIDKTKQNIYKK